MADVQLGINCGCGYKTKRLEEATEHSDKMHHTLTVYGTIKPDVDRAQLLKAVKPIDAEASIADIDALRAKLKA